MKAEVQPTIPAPRTHTFFCAAIVPSKLEIGKIIFIYNKANVNVKTELIQQPVLQQLKSLIN